MKRVTIKDVADHAGVSITAVSFVLNNTPGHTISRLTREKVLASARKLDYHPDIKAQGMRTRKPMVIGLVSFWNVTEPVFTQVLEGVYQAAEGSNLIVTICNMNKPQRAFNYVDLFKRKQIDGIVFLSPFDSRNAYDENAHIKMIKEYGIPAVILHGNTRDPDLSYLYVDHFNTTYMAVQYLLQLGHTNLGYMDADTGEASHIAQKRYQGYCAALNQAGLPVNPDMIFKADSGNRIAERIKRGYGPSAIVVNKTMYATSFLKTLLDHGIKVPDQISVIAGNTSPYGRFLYPALTSVQVPFTDMGEKGLTILEEVMSGSKRNHKLTMPNKLVVGSSCSRLL